MKTIKHVHKAIREAIGDLITYRAMPLPDLPMNLLDPFILLNHHGYQEYPPGNNGLPFGPHPHRGFETVTFILEGDLVHKDTSGAESKIPRGGIQWMTAGRGLVHAELSSEDFRRQGGAIELLQLWVNLPARNKMADPAYYGALPEELPHLETDDSRVHIQVISGNWEGVSGYVQPLTDIHLARVDFKAGGRHTFSIPNGQTVLLYVVRGHLRINGESCSLHSLVEFNTDGTIIEMKAAEESIIIFGYATPFHEPFFAYGPFVMNSQEEIREAYKDYHDGKMGKI